MTKSLDVSKAMDKAAGAEREVVGRLLHNRPSTRFAGAPGEFVEGAGADNYGPVTAPATDLARKWAGWGTALKPAFEPIVLARKPLIGTVVANVTKYGTGALNIDASRISFRDDADLKESVDKNQHADFGTEPGGNKVYGDYSMVPKKNYKGGVVINRWKDGAKPFGGGAGHEYETVVSTAGRWPANVLISHSASCVEVGTKRVVGGNFGGGGPRKNAVFGADTRARDAAGYADAEGMETVAAWDCSASPDCAVRLLDEQGGVSKSASGTQKYKRAETTGWIERGGSFTPGREWEAEGCGDSGGPSRFFATFGRDPLPIEGEETVTRFLYTAKAGREDRSGSNHPTVKPVDLMRWLCRLVTPPSVSVLVCSDCGNPVLRGMRSSAIGVGHAEDTVPSVVRTASERIEKTNDSSAETMRDVRGGLQAKNRRRSVLREQMSWGIPEATPSAVRPVRDDISSEEQRSEVLSEGLRRHGDGSSGQDVRGLREPSSQGRTVLRSGVLSEGDRPVEKKAVPSDAEGIQDSLPTVPFDVEQAGLCAGAQAGDVGSPGSEPVGDGSRSSRQRDQGRQSTSESSTDDENRARPPYEREQASSGEMPELPPRVRPAWSCSICGGKNTVRKTHAGIILDPFAGSGSTASAALREGFRCVLIEKDHDYFLGIQKWRANIQLGIGL